MLRIVRNATAHLRRDSKVVLFGDKSKDFKLVDVDGTSNVHNWGAEAFGLFDLTDYDRKNLSLSLPLSVAGSGLLYLGTYDLVDNILEFENSMASFALAYIGFYVAHMSAANYFAGFQAQTRKFRQMEIQLYPVVENISMDDGFVSFQFFDGKTRTFDANDLEIIDGYFPETDSYLKALSARSRVHYEAQIRLSPQLKIDQLEKATTSSYLSSISGFIVQRVNVLAKNFIFVHDKVNHEHFRIPVQIPTIAKSKFQQYNENPFVHDLAKALWQRSKKIDHHSFLEMMQISQKKFQFRYVICFYQQTNTLFWTKILGDPKYKKTYWKWRLHAFFHFIWRAKIYLILPAGLGYLYFTET